jgi:hypothetical protein
MNVLDLFSGIGGFSLGLERAGMRTVAFCEIDKYCRKVLGKHWPQTPICEDIRTMETYRTAEGAGNGFIRARSFAWHDREAVQRQSAIHVGCIASADQATRQNQGVAPQRTDCNSQETFGCSSSVSITGGSDYESAGTGGSGKGPNLPLMQRAGNGCGSHSPSCGGGADGNGQSSVALSPLPPRKIQNRKEEVNGSHADIGPIDVICGGFP